MPSLSLLHLTDTHLFGDASRHYDVVDTADHLRRALDHVAHLGFDLVVCSGDVSEDGTEASYERVRDTLLPWASERGARAIFAMGNHDRRESFRAILGDGQPGAETSQLLAGEAPDRPVASVATVNGWRTIVLDTSVPQAGYGELGSAQLEALAAELASPAEHGTIIVMHHPPVDAQTELLGALDLDAADAAVFRGLLRGSDVRVVLAGHYHLPIVETVAGVPVVVAPGVANLATAFGDASEESASDEYGGATVTVSDDRVRVVPFTRPVTGGEVFRMDADTVQRVIGVAGRP
ncbi:metallophosphoesterase family protein [Leucobacter albus]|uniref:Metallophosphoesterase family protein n=1 Tax=Leucobacter albus TaxID=272210 RepID=A0ABW3TR67_9MICO